MMKRRAVIVGSEGQDGTLMRQYLLAKKYDLFLINRSNFDISDKNEISKLIRSYKPHVVFFFAALHKSSQDTASNFSEEIVDSININSFSPIFFLEAILQFSISTRFFYASSTLIFSASENLINEASTPDPSDSYGISKLVTMQAIRSYREKGVFASCGILSNHESKYRNIKFLSKKIVTKAVDAYFGDTQKLVIGDVSAYVDWSYAPDFIDLMYDIILQETPGDFILASGEIKQVKDFIKVAFNEVGLDYNDYIEENKSIIKRSNGTRKFDISKVQKLLNWKPRHSFDEMVKKLVNDEIGERKSH